MVMGKGDTQMMRKDVAGSSMVSVMVAFLLLMMGIAMFTTVLYFTANLLQNVENTKTKVYNTVEEYYLDENPGGIPVFASDDISFKEKKTNKRFKLEGNAYKYDSDDYEIYYFKNENRIGDE